MRIISWIITIPFLLALLGFAFDNRTDVTVSFWPFDLQITSPLFVVSLGILFLGLMVGGILGWISSLRYKFQINRLQREVSGLTKKLEALHFTPNRYMPDEYVVPVAYKAPIPEPKHTATGLKV